MSIDPRISLPESDNQEKMTIITAESAREAGPLLKQLVEHGPLAGIEWATAFQHEQSNLLVATSKTQSDGTRHQLYVINAKIQYVAEDADGRPVCDVAAIIALLGFCGGNYKAACIQLSQPASCHKFTV